MNTPQHQRPNRPAHSQQISSRIPRILALGAALGIVSAALTGTAVAAPGPHDGPREGAGHSVPAHGHHEREGHPGGGHDDDGDDCDGLLVLICHG
jgi:anti-sigma factor RsiW